MEKHVPNKSGRRTAGTDTPTYGTPKALTSKAPVLTISEALNKGIENSDGKAYHIGRTRACARQFLQFCKEREAGLQSYSDIRPEHLRRFVAWCNERDLSPTTVRNYMNPLRLASRYVEENMPDQYNPLFFKRICPRARIPAKRFLTMDRYVACMEMCRKRADHTAIYTLFLGGLAGLRFEEIVNLKQTDFNDADMTISTGQKNQYSERLIPLLKPVYEYAKMYITFYGDKPFRNLETLSKAMARVTKRMYKQTGDETYNLLMPRDCGRKTFWNLAADNGVQIEYLRAYAGHSAGGSVAEKHYLDLTPQVLDMPDYKTVKLAAMKREVIDKLEGVLANAGIK
jgi:integrase